MANYLLKAPISAVRVGMEGDTPHIADEEVPSWVKNLRVTEMLYPVTGLGYAVRVPHFPHTTHTQYAKDGDYIVYDNNGSLHVWGRNDFERTFKPEE